MVRQSQLKIVFIAGIVDVLLAGALLILILLGIIVMPLFIPLLLLLAGIGIAVGAGLAQTDNQADDEVGSGGG